MLGANEPPRTPTPSPNHFVKACLPVKKCELMNAQHRHEQKVIYLVSLVSIQV